MKLGQDCWLERVQGEGETTSPSLSDGSKIMTAKQCCIGQDFPKIRRGRALHMCPQQRLQSPNHVVTSDLLYPPWSFICSELWPWALGDPRSAPSSRYQGKGEAQNHGDLKTSGQRRQERRCHAMLWTETQVQEVKNLSSVAQ